MECVLCKKKLKQEYTKHIQGNLCDILNNSNVILCTECNSKYQIILQTVYSEKTRYEQIEELIKILM